MADLNQVKMVQKCQTKTKHIGTTDLKQTRIDNPKMAKPCEFCSKEYTQIKKHVKRCIKNPSFRPFTCENCKQKFSRKDALMVHVRKKSCQKESRRNCLISDCKFTYMFKTSLINHLKDIHNLEIEPEETFVFKTWAEFMKWKDDIEEQTMSYYSLRSGEKNGRLYYYCQHDGPTKSHVKCQPAIKRKPNLKGRIKRGIVCTSMLKVCKANSGSVQVTYLPTHSHPIEKSDLLHQPLNRETNNFINHHLCLGESPKNILNMLKEKNNAENKSTEDSSNCSRKDVIPLRSIRERKKNLLRVASIVSSVKPSRVDRSKHYKDKILSMNTELMDRIQNDKVPKFLLPHIHKVLSELLTECCTVEDMKLEPNSKTMMPPEKKTYKLSQFPPKSRKENEESNHPTCEDIPMGDDELDRYIIEQDCIVTVYENGSSCLAVV
ncbi:hypothetical protein M8J77_016487 [Diaphorina citri]|nr:hypothetical protein M8J77_016487 [Diaphorina citri]